MCATAPAHAAPLENSESDDYGDGDDFYGFVATVKRGDQLSAVFADDDCDRSKRAATGKPIAPTNDEAGVIADGATREIVLAATAWNGRAEFGHGGCTEQGIKPADNPNTEKEPGIWQDFRDDAGGANDPSSDGVAHGGGDAEPDAEDLQ